MVSGEDFPLNQPIVSVEYLCLNSDVFSAPLFSALLLVLWGWVKTDYSNGIDGPNRKRWFTVLKHGESFHGYVSHNQRVYIYI